MKSNDRISEKQVRYDLSLRGDSISIEFQMSSWEEARKIFNNADVDSKEWQDIFEAIFKAFGTKMKEEDEVN